MMASWDESPGLFSPSWRYSSSGWSFGDISIILCRYFYIYKKRQTQRTRCAPCGCLLTQVWGRGPQWQAKFGEGSEEEAIRQSMTLPWQIDVGLKIRSVANANAWAEFRQAKRISLHHQSTYSARVLTIMVAQPPN